MNRDQLKSVLKKLVLQEITNNQFGTPDHSKDEDGVKALEKAVGKDGNVSNPPGTGAVISNTPKHAVKLVKNANDLYDVVSVTNGSDRRTAKSLKLEDVADFVKKHATETEKSYTEKAYDKSQKGFGKETKEEKKSEKDADQMKDAEEEKQVDVADKSTAKADEKVNKDLAPVDDENSAEQGGQLVDKFEKTTDRDSKEKAETKKSYLKADSKMESPDKLKVKIKDTPALKEISNKELVAKVERIIEMALRK